MPENNQLHKIFNLIDTVILKLLGYLLVFFGVGMMIYLGLHVWELYNTPELSIRYAEYLRDTLVVEIPYSLIKIFAWLLVVLLLMLIGRIAFMAIEAGHLLITKGHHEDKHAD